MGVQERRLIIPAVLDKITTACDFVSQVAHTAGLDDDAIYHCHLSVEEVCTNIVEHGYGFQETEQQITIICLIEPKRFIIIIIDNAPPFDPLNQAEPDKSAPLQARKHGGWGIHFVRQYMDEVTYEYKQNSNQLRMTKYR